MVRRLIYALLAPGAVSVLLSGCNGIFSGIYDDPAGASVPEYGFQTPASGSAPGVLYVDATDYRRWTYIDFASMRIDTLAVDAPAPEVWDVAVHRYDAKTNGGAVWESSARGFGEEIIGAEGGEYAADVWTESTIITDMSTMADGYLSYAADDYNATLSRWLDVDKSTMPPVYTLSGRVYVVRTADGRELALRLANFMDGAGVKGYLTIEWKEL